ncbi:MAG: hypothetical protein RL744_643 [Pseudomonadota bacterium]|jgi:hypothetical protein
MIKIIRSILFIFRINLVRLTGEDKLKAFFNSIQPKITDINLIRIGGASDGGYLVPNDLDGIIGCFSPGVAGTANFELELASRNIKSFLADYSVDGSPVEHDLISFEKKFIGLETNDQFININEWYKKNATQAGDYILQMDIEGGEYAVINTIDENILNTFRVLVIEFHNLHYLIQIPGFDLINFAFNKLLQNFEIVHIHPNNESKPLKVYGFEIPNTMEFTFLRKDRISASKPNTVFPHPLDVANFTDRDDFALPKCWQS